MALLRAETLVDALALVMSPWGQHGFLEGRGTCESLSGFHVVRRATLLFRGPRHLRMPQRFPWRCGNNMALLRTEPLVDALAVSMSFWRQHGSLEGRGTCGRLSGFHVGLETLSRAETLLDA